ncbi:protein tyrosine kinase domain-containing protein [Ditylenchus destructor]|nr:protein tyrosine kinase domain-containing protein [Ditylenchus destructor]
MPKPESFKDLQRLFRDPMFPVVAQYQTVLLYGMLLAHTIANGIGYTQYFNMILMAFGLTFVATCISWFDSHCDTRCIRLFLTVLQFLLLVIATMPLMVILMNPAVVFGQQLISRWLIFILTLMPLTFWKGYVIWVSTSADNPSLQSTANSARSGLTVSLLGEQTQEESLSDGSERAQVIVNSRTENGGLEDTHITTIEVNERTEGTTYADSSSSTIQSPNAISQASNRNTATESSNRTLNTPIPTIIITRSSAENLAVVENATSSHHTSLGGTYVMSGIEVLRQIGSGHFGTVHVAEMKDANGNSQQVAVKSVSSRLGLGDIIHEIVVLSKCKHKNIVQCYQFESRGNCVHINVTVGRAMNYIFQICEAMEYLANIRIVHRDLAARNCLLSRNHTLLKVCDFGIARMTDNNFEYCRRNINQLLPFRWTAPECFMAAGKDPPIGWLPDETAMGVPERTAQHHDGVLVAASI